MKIVEELTWEVYEPLEFPCMRPGCSETATKMVTLKFYHPKLDLKLCLCETCSELPEEIIAGGFVRLKSEIKKGGGNG